MEKPPIRRPAWGRRATLAAALLAVVAMCCAALLWLLRTEAGAAWVLGRLPGVQASGVRGVLLGDLAVQRLAITLPRNGSLTIDDASWQGLRLAWAISGRPHLVLDRLAAARVTVTPGAPAATTTPAPTTLALPVELEIGAIEIAAVQIVPLGETALRQLRAKLHLGADGGAVHRIDGLSLGFGRLRASGSATLGSDAPLPLQATVALTQEGAVANAQWSARATLAGPLAQPRLAATLRAEPAPAPGAATLPAQTLDLGAVLRPFEAWPIGELAAKAQGLDLSAFHPSAPATVISGSATARSQAANQPAHVSATLDNATPGLWNEGRLPLRQLVLELQARPDDPSRLEVRRFDAELGTARQPAGRLQGQGRWANDGWLLEVVLAALQPARLDARAPAMRLDGPLTLTGSPPGAAAQTVAARADIAGVLADRGKDRAVRLQLDGDWTRNAGADVLQLTSAQASAGGARATLAGRASRPDATAAWQLKGQATLAEFDPSLWWRGREDSPWRRGPHKLDARGEFDLSLPPAALAAKDALARWAALRGDASVKLADSLLAGVPLRGELTLRGGAAGRGQATLKAELDGNRIDASGRLGSARGGADDAWEATLDAPALARLAPLTRLVGADPAGLALSGALSASVQATGRWPVIRTSGRAQASALRAGTVTVQRGTARWQAGTALEAPVDAELDLAGLAIGTARIDTAQLRAQGSGRAHRIDLQAQSNARPPAWAEALQPTPASGDGKAPTQARLQAQGGFLPGTVAAVGGWRGTLQQLEAGSAGGEPAWLRLRDVALELGGLDGAAAQLLLQPGRAELLGAALRWERISWTAAHAGAPMQLDAKAELEPLAVAPLLQRLHPEFGWGGDLRVRGQLEWRSAPALAADIVIERERGDLTVTDETGVQSLGLTDLRIGLNVADGVWSFTQGLAGSTVGVAAGAFVARTTPQSPWPNAGTPVSGVLELQVGNLGTWSPWVPAGWRLGGALRISAGIGGRLGALEYTGAVRGSQLSVRNFLQGVNVTDGEIRAELKGETARIETFSARAGAGTVTLSGDAHFGSAPVVRLALEAQRFQLLGRVDRRIVVSGSSTLQIDRERLALEGRLGIDEGLIDFTRSDAPGLSDDVFVERRPATRNGAAEARPAATTAAQARQVDVDLRV
uniref:translocation/assembly module TamB domain-containing protein n=1 Tax=Variovorax sp. YR752 TaxID=1884383 RepID=UPI003137DDF8